MPCNLSLKVTFGISSSYLVFVDALNSLRVLGFDLCFCIVVFRAHGSMATSKEVVSILMYLDIIFVSIYDTYLVM